MNWINQTDSAGIDHDRSDGHKQNGQSISGSSEKRKRRRRGEKFSRKICRDDVKVVLANENKKLTQILQSLIKIDSFYTHSTLSLKNYLSSK